ncbi:transglycosylase family protein [Streptomyces sp. NPDC051561]|uniref:transglycosylase family protein n=1 Tax=Streptomyces sp. NPDC051561 TaxID=3365658 RepID=UPI003790FC76
MRSGNGRHRRPRQAPALIVAAGVTGSALAIPLLGATSASAADANTWDRVAECESGGMWSADLGNGYYGGLQFSQEKWEQYGGVEYAPQADLASRAQQVRVAEKMLAAEGPQAWPSCAVISGLAPGGGNASGSGTGGVDAADPGADAGTDSGAQTRPPAGHPTDGDAQDGTPDAGTPSGGATAPATPTTPAEPTPGSSVSPSTGPNATPGEGTDPDADPSTGRPAPGATPGTETPATPGQPDASTGNGKHRGTPAPENSLPGTGSSADPSADPSQDPAQDPTQDPSADPSADPTAPPGADDRESGRHASRGGGKSPAGPGEEATYTVRAGDNLWHIADEEKVPGGWAALYEANRGELGGDPDLILPGQHLELGAK